MLYRVRECLKRAAYHNSKRAGMGLPALLGEGISLKIEYNTQSIDSYGV